jgi:hypothetical protein
MFRCGASFTSIGIGQGILRPILKLLFGLDVQISLGTKAPCLIVSTTVRLFVFSVCD